MNTPPASTSASDWTIRTPRDRTRVGSLKAVTLLGREIWVFRAHIWTVFKSDFRSAYHGTAIGAFWNLLLPLVPLTVYLFLAKLRAFPSFEGVSGSTYLVFGVTLWFLLVGCIRAPMEAIRARNSDAMKTAFPLSAAVSSAFAATTYELLIRSVVVIAVMIATESWPVVQAAMLPLVLIPALLLFTGIGLIIGILNVISSDFSRVTNIVLQYGIFVSGVIFPLPNIPSLQTVNALNPFAIYIDACRDIVFRGHTGDLTLYILAAVSVLVFLLSCRIFYAMEIRIRGIN